MLGSMKKSMKMSSSIYIPGTCNLGGNEIRLRKLVGLVGLFFLLASIATMVVFVLPF